MSIANRSEVDERDKLTAFSDPQHMVLLFDSASLGGSDLLEIGARFEVHSDAIPSSGTLSIISLSVAVPLLEQPSVLGTAIAGSPGTSALAPAGEPSMSAADVIGTPMVLPALLIKVKEQVTGPPSADDF